MGSGKKEAARRERQGKGGDGLDNVKTKGENFYRYALEGFQTIGRIRDLTIALV
jgi:hypothetical protein